MNPRINRQLFRVLGRFVILLAVVYLLQLPSVAEAQDDSKTLFIKLITPLRC